MQPDAKDVDQEDRRDEAGDGGPDRRDQKTQVVDGRVLLQRTDDPERDREGERDQECLDAQLRGDADPLTDDVRDRPAALHEARAEVTAQKVSDVYDELLGDRLVDTEIAVEVCDRLFRKRTIGGPIARAA